LSLAEVQTASGELDFPYIPGFLSFREIPLAIKAFEKLNIIPDLVIVDGQGIAHPRRLGIASHLGLVLDIPTVGCAKSHLIGDYEIPGRRRGSFSDLVVKGEVIGAVLRSRDKVAPLFISIGNKINLAAAVTWTLDTGRGYRLPEPARLAHIAAGGNLKILAGKVF
jgi:deoxyribonuclease V